MDGVNSKQSIPKRHREHQFERQTATDTYAGIKVKRSDHHHAKKRSKYYFQKMIMVLIQKKEVPVGFPFFF